MKKIFTLLFLSAFVQFNVIGQSRSHSPDYITFGSIYEFEKNDSIIPEEYENFDREFYDSFESKFSKNKNTKFWKEDLLNFFSYQNKILSDDSIYGLIHIVTSFNKSVRIVSYRVRLKSQIIKFASDTLVSPEKIVSHLERKKIIESIIEQILKDSISRPELIKEYEQFLALSNVKYLINYRAKYFDQIGAKNLNFCVNPHEFFLNRRIKKATSLIRSFIDSISEIQMSGRSFYNVQNFAIDTIQFKKLKGKHLFTYKFLVDVALVKEYLKQCGTPKTDSTLIRYGILLAEKLIHLHDTIDNKDNLTLSGVEQNAWDKVGGYRKNYDRLREILNVNINKEGNWQLLKNQADSLFRIKNFIASKLKYVELYKFYPERSKGIPEKIKILEQLRLKEFKNYFYQWDSLFKQGGVNLILKLAEFNGVPQSKLVFPTDSLGEFNVKKADSLLHIIASYSREGNPAFSYFITGNSKEFSVILELNLQTHAAQAVKRLSNFAVGSSTFDGIEIFYNAIYEFIKESNKIILNQDKKAFDFNISISGTADAIPYSGKMAITIDESKEYFIYEDENGCEKSMQIIDLDLNKSFDKNILLAYRRAAGLRNFLLSYEILLPKPIHALVFNSKGGDYRNIQCIINFSMRPV